MALMGSGTMARTSCSAATFPRFDDRAGPSANDDEVTCGAGSHGKQYRSRNGRGPAGRAAAVDAGGYGTLWDQECSGERNRGGKVRGILLGSCVVLMER